MIQQNPRYNKEMSKPKTPHTYQINSYTHRGSMQHMPLSINVERNNFNNLSNDQSLINDIFN